MAAMPGVGPKQTGVWRCESKVIMLIMFVRPLVCGTAALGCFGHAQGGYDGFVTAVGFEGIRCARRSCQFERF